MDFINQIICGNTLEVLKTLPDEFVSCCVTSPPYYGLRNYGMNEQIGLEETPEKYINKLVDIFREVKRVLKKDGSLWLNLGDSYVSAKGRHSSCPQTISGKRRGEPTGGDRPDQRNHPFLKDKDLFGIPWRTALALQKDGWWLRQDCIWSKPNPMPESVKDRCTKSHEYIFLLSKSAKYYFDNEAIKEDSINEESYTGRRFRGRAAIYGSGAIPKCSGNTIHSGGNEILGKKYEKRNRRSVWTIPVSSGNGIHFAVFPESLVEPCVLAGCPKGGTVLDPFAGSCTTGRVAVKLGRNYICIELNPKYINEIGQYKINEAETGISKNEQLQEQQPLFKE